MPQIANVVLNNGTADKTFSVSLTKGQSHNASWRDVTVSPAICQPQMSVSYGITDTRRNVRLKVSNPVLGVDTTGRSTKVGLVEVDIQLRADLNATEAEIAAVLRTAANAITNSAGNTVIAPVFYKGEALY